MTSTSSTLPAPVSPRVGSPAETYSGLPQASVDTDDGGRLRTSSLAKAAAVVPVRSNAAQKTASSSRLSIVAT